MPELVQEHPALTGFDIVAGAESTGPEPSYKYFPRRLPSSVTIEGASPPAWLRWLLVDSSEATVPVRTFPCQPIPVGTMDPSALSLLCYADAAIALDIVRGYFGVHDVLSDPRRFVAASNELDHARRGFTADAVSSEAPSSELHLRLRELQDWTRMSPTELAPLVGTSRRSIYHWLSTGTIGKQASTRIARLHSALKPMGESRDPLLIRAWLTHGEPSPGDLASAERWEELEPLIAEQLRSLEPIQDESETSSAEVGHSAEVRMAALLAFANISVPKSIPRSGWRPREVTGIAEGDMVDD